MPETEIPSQRLVRLRVERIPHESLTFLVESESYELADGESWQDHAYRVDLETLPVVTPDGRPVRNGMCMCGNFDKRRHKQAEAGEETRCKHILAALVYYAEERIVEESMLRKGGLRRNLFAGLPDA